MIRNLSKNVLFKKDKVIAEKQKNYLKENLNSFLKTNPRARICVIRSVGGLGDVLMISPSLIEIKTRYPSCHLTFAIDRHTSKDSYYKLLMNCKFIDSFIDARYLNKKNYDYTVDLSSVCIRYENSTAPKINRIDLFARHLGFARLINKLPFYKVEPDEQIKAQAFIQKTNPEKKIKVALHTASFDLMRTWPVTSYMELIKASEKYNIVFYVFDFNHQSNKWKLFPNVVECSNTTVREMAALINEMDLFIGPDSGPMHLAGALQKASIVLFGSIPPEIRINYYKSHAAIVHPNLKCLGCMYGPCHYNIKCMRDLSYELVLNKMKERLKL